MYPSLGEPTSYAEKIKQKWFSAQSAKARAELLAAKKRAYYATQDSIDTVDAVARIPVVLNGLGSGYNAEQEGSGSGDDYPMIADISAQLESAEDALALTEQLISQYGYDKGQYDLWMNLFVGADIPPGYSSQPGLVSYEMLTGQRDSWRLAFTRSYTTLVSASNVFVSKLINFLFSVNAYLLESASPDKELVKSYMARATPLAQAAETVNSITEGTLKDIFETYRSEMRRLDFGLNKLGVPPLDIPDSVNWLVWGAIAVGAIILGNKVL